MASAIENVVIELDDADVVEGTPKTLRKPQKEIRKSDEHNSYHPIADSPSRSTVDNHKHSFPEHKKLRLSLREVRFGSVGFKVHNRLTVTERQMLVEVLEMMDGDREDGDPVHWYFDYARHVSHIDVCFDERLNEPVLVLIVTEECSRMIRQTISLRNRRALKSADRNVVMFLVVEQGHRTYMSERLTEFFDIVVEPSLQRSLLHNITVAEAQVRLRTFGSTARRSERSSARKVSSSMLIELAKDDNESFTTVRQTRKRACVNRTLRTSEIIVARASSSDDGDCGRYVEGSWKKTPKIRKQRSVAATSSGRRKYVIETESIDLMQEEDDDQVDAVDYEMMEAASSSASSSTELLVYPLEELGAVTIRSNDLATLDKEAYLNDTIVDFYLKYIVRELISDQRRSRVHVFPCFFWHRLTSKPTSDVASIPGAIEMSKSKVVMANQYHHVRSWTKNVDVFDKDFLIVPVNEKQHWYLAIVCSPFLTTPDALENGVDLDSMVAPPCVLILDSLQETSANRYKTAAVLKNYLQLEWNDKHGANGQVDRSKLKGIYPLNVPQQDNYSDCGIYMLEYARRFLLHPPSAAKLSAGRFCDFAKWYPDFSTTNKRIEIRKLIETKRQSLLDSTAVESDPIDFDASNAMGKLLSTVDDVQVSNAVEFHPDNDEKSGQTAEC